jgi:RHS repeat-associated protein
MNAMIRRAVHASLVVAFLALGTSRAAAQEVIEYYGIDAVGSIRVVFAPDGTVKARSEYLPFGEEWAPATPGGPLPTQRFTGQQRDSEEGHDNFNARTYLTRAGRMTSPDPVMAGLFEPQRWNRYAHGLNNPLSYVDPTGLKTLRYYDYTEVQGGGANGPSIGLDALYISLIFGPTNQGQQERRNVGGGGGRPRMGIDDKGNVTREEEVTVTPTTDEGAALDGSEIPACAGCIPYTGEPDKFMGNDDLVSNFLNGGGLSLGGLFKTGSGFVAKGAFSRILSISPRMAQKGWDKHASVLGLGGNWHPGRASEFRGAVNQFINNPAVRTIEGRYHTLDVIHYLNTRTNVNVVSDRNGNYISVFQLGADQLQSVLTKGWLW